MSLVAVGACYVDTILTTPHYPSEDEKQRASGLSHRRGGNCPNTLEVLQQLTSTSSQPLSSHLIAVLPARSSFASQRIIAGLEPGVQLNRCIFRENLQEPASCYIIKSQATGSRTIVNFNELPDMTVDEFVERVDGLEPTPAWFHFEGRIPDVTRDCIRYIELRFPSSSISVEIERPGRPGLQDLAELADVVFFAKSWALHRGYTSAQDCLLNESQKIRKASLLCCTWGEDGASALEPQTGNTASLPAYTANNFEVIDPIGAGDTFIAGMLYVLNYEKEWDLDRKVEFANRVAGMKVSQEGFGGLARALESNSPE